MTIKDNRDAFLSLLVDFTQVCEEHGWIYFLVGGSALGAVREGGFIPWDDDMDISMPRKDFEAFLEYAKTEFDGVHCLSRYENGGEYCYKYVASEFEAGNVIEPYIDINPLDGAPKNRIVRALRMLRIDIAHIGVKMETIQQCHTGEDRSGIKNVLIKFLKIIHSEKWSNAERCRRQWDRLARKNNYETSNWAFSAYGVYGIHEYIPKEWIGNGKFLKFEDKYFRVYQNCEGYLTNIYGDYMTPRKTIKR